MRMDRPLPRALPVTTAAPRILGAVESCAPRDDRDEALLELDRDVFAAEARNRGPNYRSSSPRNAKPSPPIELASGWSARLVSHPVGQPNATGAEPFSRSCWARCFLLIWRPTIAPEHSQSSRSPARLRALSQTHR